MMIFDRGRLTIYQVLKSTQFALNTLPNRGLVGCPNGFKDTYDLARYIDYWCRTLEVTEPKGDPQ